MARVETPADQPARARALLLGVVLPPVVAAATLLAVAGGVEGRGLELAAAAGRGLMYVGVLLAAGGGAFLVLVHDRRRDDLPPMTRIVTVAALLGAVGTLVGIPIQAAEVLGTGVEGMLDGAALEHVLSGSFGQSALVRLVGLTVLLVGVSRLWTPWAAVACLVGALAALGSFLLTGHTATTEPRWLVVSANYLHTMTGAAWFGGLTLLGVALARRRAEQDANGGVRMVARFSTLALVSVTALLVAGTALSWAEVRSLAALTATGYGRTLLTKVTLVLLIVAVGAYNNLRLVPAIQRGAGNAWTLLTRTVRIEVVGIIAVLGVTALLVNLVPARNFVPTEAVDLFADLGEDHRVNLVVDPAEAGDNEIHLYLFGDTGGVTDVADEVILHLEPPGAGEAPIEIDPVSAGPGHFFHAGPELATAGEWTIGVEVDLASGHEHDTVTFAVPIGESDGGHNGGDMEMEHGRGDPAG